MLRSLLKLLFAITLVDGVWSLENCTVPIPFQIEKKCDKIIEHYKHIDIAVYIEVPYMIPMEEVCWKCVLTFEPKCEERLTWAFKGACYWYTDTECAHECKGTNSRLRRLVKKAPVIPAEHNIPPPSSTSMRHRYRSNTKQGDHCLTKNKNGSLSLTFCNDNEPAQHFSLYPIEDEFLVLSAPKKILTACEIRRNEDYFKCNVPGCMITQCDSNGIFIPKQCHLSIGYTGTCWCVDSEGQEISGTRTEPGEPQPECEEPGSPLKQGMAEENQLKVVGAGMGMGKSAGKGKGKGKGKGQKKNRNGRSLLSTHQNKKRGGGLGKKNKKNKTPIPVKDLVEKKKPDGLCDFGMKFHKQWGNNIIKCTNTLNSCQVYEKVNQEFGGTCQDFCEGFNLLCKTGWKDLSDYTCEKGLEIGCIDHDGYTSDHICECVVPKCGCDQCIPVPQDVEVERCVNEIELPEFYSAPLTDWSLAMISQKCQHCVHKKDFSCQSDPWVPSGNRCVHHAVSTCKKVCNLGPKFPRDTFNPLNDKVCLASSGMFDTCGPEHVLQIVRLPHGLVEVKKNKMCLSITGKMVGFTPCKKKQAHQWYLEVVL